MTKLRIYYAHPISMYWSDEEKRVVKALEAAGYEVINPSDEIHARAVEQIKEQYKDDPAEGSRRVMSDYFIPLAQSCDICGIQSFPDKSFGAGAAGEARGMLERGQAVHEIIVEADRIILTDPITALPAERCLDVDSTRAMLNKLGRPTPPFGGKPA